MADLESAIDKVTHFGLEIKSLGIHLRRIILFGSYVKNMQQEWSDIDVALVADEFTGFGFNDRKFFSKVNIKKEYQEIETKTYPPDYFEIGDPFIEEIRKTGIEIKL